MLWGEDRRVVGWVSGFIWGDFVDGGRVLVITLVIVGRLDEDSVVVEVFCEDFFFDVV